MKSSFTKKVATATGKNPVSATLFVLVGLSLIHLQKILFKIPYVAFKPSIVSVCFSNSKYFRPLSPFFFLQS